VKSWDSVIRWRGVAALGDVDGDGDLDAFLGNFRYNGEEADKVYFNNGTGVFSDSGQNIGKYITTSVALGDVNGDGYLDAIATSI